MKELLLEKLGQWHGRLDSFFAASFSKHAKQMKCASGCDLCCHVERTVFTIEADLIRTYVNETPLPTSAENTTGKCAFLSDGKCSIYSVRPSICRSHGLVLNHQEGPSHCELNFEAGLPPKEDWLASETADTVLSTLQIAYEKEVPSASNRVSLRELWCELTGSGN